MLRHPVAILACLAALAARPAFAESPLAGAYQPHELEFTYAGVGARFSCDGLAEQLTLLLRLAGAGPGASARPGCVRPPGALDRIASAKLSFATLAPDAAGDPVAGRWRPIAWGPGTRALDDTDCELVKQFVKEVLPLFSVRNVYDHTSCTPHLATRLVPLEVRFEVFAAR
jgi:hypothetical protein